jgi:outer membrane protein
VKRVAAAVAAAALVLPGCSLLPKKSVQEGVSPGPEQPWAPPAAGKMPEPVEPAKALEVPAEYMKPGATVSLGELVDFALRNNPVTRQSWFQARAAASEVGSKRSLYFPYAEVDGSIQRQKTAAVGGRFTFLQTTYGPSVAASWLLFNFGGREAEVQEATRALYAADWTHNAAIQSVVLSVAQAYYQYLNAKAQVAAQKASLEEAKRNLEAAEERHRAGVATIADVLQAKTQASQVELALQTAQGQVLVVRGSLATAIGLSATVPVDVGELPTELPLDLVKSSVDQLIARAEAERPDLAAERFRALAAQSHILAAAVDGLPSLSIGASGNRTFYHQPNVADPFSTNWSGLISLRIPIFRGFDTAYKVQQAKDEAEAAKASAKLVEDQVVLDVWASYYAMQTAAQRVLTTRDLLASATQAAEVNDGRYRAGVGSILDLLSAQAALANARSEEAQARSIWFLAVAQLAYATGVLQPGAPEIRSLPTRGYPGAESPPDTKGNP